MAHQDLGFSDSEEEDKYGEIESSDGPPLREWSSDEDSDDEEEEE